MSTKSEIGFIEKLKVTRKRNSTAGLPITQLGELLRWVGWWKYWLFIKHVWISFCPMVHVLSSLSKTRREPEEATNCGTIGPCFEMYLRSWIYLEEASNFITLKSFRALLQVFPEKTQLYVIQYQIYLWEGWFLKMEKPGSLSSFYLLKQFR